MTASASNAVTSRVAKAGEGSLRDHRGSWIPTVSMITTRIMELRRRKGLMAAMIVVNIGVPTIFLLVRLIAHAVVPKSYGPAGGYDIFSNLVAGVMYVFGFIVAATLGCTAGSVDLSEGMFRHLVITGRSRVALYFARIPAGLALIVPLVAVGFTIVCAVCVFAAPTKLYYEGVNVPPGLTLSGFESWASQHPKEAVCGLPYDGPIGIPCFINGKGKIVNPPGVHVKKISEVTLKADAVKIAKYAYVGYSQQFLSPPTSLMVKAGLWIELEAIIGFVVGLGLGSLLGQRTVSVVLMLVLEVVLTPIFIRSPIRHLINAQRGLVGLATAHLEPGGLPTAFGGGSPNGVAQIVPETTTVAVCVIIAWLVVWTALGAWRMATRDA
ncbi:MAG TPA: hypothetical protein VG246_09825 [Acidimicrobiales bacterium]|nr:hypothetical protein [Acidimicrobiales bacterium]